MVGADKIGVLLALRESAIPIEILKLKNPASAGEHSTKPSSGTHNKGTSR